MSSSDQLTAASETYKSLKNVQGHWQGKPFNTDVDAPNSKKEVSMKYLQEYLGKVGTSADDILNLMGKPDKELDKPDIELVHELNRQSYQCQDGTKIWIYEWRGMHDYVYFLIKDNKVALSAWYYAYE
ncbi:unnamed protein product [Didymodactylos carnosus]|uniref:Uncharacterized protein n=1 Tax=Didymodactylos carnosus TaxID=1234261 RepID=A0A814G2K4_9BILA|nr:unnamed protein product [Didymodactylos carnosus]CAF1061741.1 unnamed protein product [Didymodactylos carnosus]CAF3760400.1 unnamed protein product [Didymodactylos carnosus]CAF3827321.1 unnamed protein product [Didymodactylos carnosus]